MTISLSVIRNRSCCVDSTESFILTEKGGKPGSLVYKDIEKLKKKEPGKTMSSTTREWALDTVAQLPDSEIGELKGYLEYLVWKSEKPKRKGQPKQVLEALNKSHDVTMEDAEALLQSIKEGEIPMRFDSPFDESEKES